MHTTHSLIARAFQLLFIFNLCSSVSYAATAPHSESGAISNVSISKAFFDPRLEQSVAVSMKLAAAGEFTMEALDRDGFVVRRLADGKAVQAGEHVEVWDGKGDVEMILPPEAYSFRIQLLTSSGRSVYDPLARYKAAVVDGVPPKYSRATGSITYSLKQSARVHLQVGIGRRQGKEQKLTGVVLANVVDHEPRPAGSIVETWNGYVANTDFYLPNHPQMFIGVFATSLPENSVILSTNSTETYAEYARAHRPKDELAPRALAAHSHMFHSGLNVFEDHSPAVTIEPIGVTAASAGRKWQTDGDLKMKVTMDQSQAPFYLTPETELQVFVDDRLISFTAGASNPSETTISKADLPAGEHLVTVNWVSGHGPVGVATVEVVSGHAETGGAQ